MRHKNSCDPQKQLFLSAYFLPICISNRQISARFSWLVVKCELFGNVARFTCGGPCTISNTISSLSRFKLFETEFSQIQQIMNCDHTIILSDPHSKGDEMAEMSD